MYHIELTPKAEEELRALGRSGDKASINKVYRLFEELRVHPYEGTGKPEPLVRRGVPRHRPLLRLPLLLQDAHQVVGS